jgi:septal ring factor EnvC (AmiA/AmiB activator)
MIFDKIRKASDNAEAAVNAISRMAPVLSKLQTKLNELERRLDAISDALNDGESQKLKAEKDYIDGMYNLLNYDVSMARKPKDRVLNE